MIFGLFGRFTMGRLLIELMGTRKSWFRFILYLQKTTTLEGVMPS